MSWEITPSALQSVLVSFLAGVLSSLLAAGMMLVLERQLASDRGRAAFASVAVGLVVFAFVVAFLLTTGGGEGGPAGTSQSPAATSRAGSAKVCADGPDDPRLVSWRVSETPKGQSSLRIPVNACETLMVSSGRIVAADGQRCGDARLQLCVLVDRAPAARAVEIASVDADAVWYGITAASVEAALRNKSAEFWQSPNCGSGCDYATVRVYEPGKSPEPRIVERPPR